VGKVIAERYRIESRLGVGGMGAVYRAEHVLMKKPVAVKVLHREMTVLDEAVKRFEREAIAAGRIDHPNVAVATDFGKLDTGAFYLVLEYVPGRSLTQALAEDGAFSPDRALFVARQIAAGLAAAHAAGIVHRDLKPDNIMLIERGETKDFVKVLDFGIAKVTADGADGGQLTRLGAVFGTPAYMAPEQAAGQSVDHRADLYSLGLVLYEMLAGAPAFASSEIVHLLTKQLTEPPPPLSDAIPPEIRALVERLVEKDPNARVDSAQALVLEIDRASGASGPGSGPTMLQPEAISVRDAQPLASAATAVDVPPSSRLRGKMLAPLGHLSNLATRVAGGETVRVGSKNVPLWLFGLAAGALFMGPVLVLSVTQAGKTSPASSVSEVAPPPPELSEVLAKAERGDKKAIDELAARPAQGRTAGEWMALARGELKLARVAPALDYFAGAVKVDGTLASDSVLLAAVRKAADDEGLRQKAIELAATGLGPFGPDVLFDVWTSTTQKTEATTLAKSMLDREDVRQRASTPLRLALDLRRATKCEDVQRLLVDAKDHADERASRRLTQLASRRGCGFLGLSDCFSCLRKGDDLAAATKAAQARKAPRL
jgi:serine/threonine-protein kinase